MIKEQGVPGRTAQAKRAESAEQKQQMRQEINSRISELPRAKKRVGGHDTYICPLCGNGSGEDGDGICTNDGGKHWKCFKCGVSGDYLEFLKKLHGETEREIFDRYGLNVDSGTAPTRPSAAATQPEKNQKPDIDYTDYILQAAKALNESPEARQYIQGRGISPETAARFKLGYDSVWRSPKALREGRNPPESPRLIIPTSRFSYLARDIRPDADKKYKAMKEGRSEIFNVKALKGDAPIFITEGEIDAVSIVEVGGQALALGSTSNVRKLLEICEKEPPAVPLILTLDNDDAGRKAQAELKRGLEALKITVYEINTAGEYKDQNEHLTANRAAFTALVHSDPAEAARQEAEAEKENYLETSTAHHIALLNDEIATNKKTPAIPTGFSVLDNALDGGLYPGLYVVGAISSLGKTSFVLQVADQIAKAGYDVLIFSLEMSRYELMSKSISRITFENCDGNTGNAKTTRAILSGIKYMYYTAAENALIEESMIYYSSYAHRVYIHEGVGDIGVERIRQEIQKHITFTGNTPVVIIDYLQIIAPHDIRATDKQNTDKSVLELKRVSRDKKIPIIAISSFNRENYTAPVNLASFKESGAIEYSSDVLLGLQLAGMDDLSQSEGKRAETIRKIDEWKAAEKRKAQLKILKNRNGKTGTSVYYEYDPRFNHFKEIVAPDEKAAGLKGRL